jgi:hypothetical protein
VQGRDAIAVAPAPRSPAAAADRARRTAADAAPRTAAPALPHRHRARRPAAAMGGDGAKGATVTFKYVFIPADT